MFYLVPSWKVHRLVGEIVCFGFYNHKIDRLIDSKGSHDAGRYDEAIFKNEALMMLREFGGNGLCYYVLHHVLDRLQDLLVSELVYGYEQYVQGHDIEEIYEGIRSRVLGRLRNDPKTAIPEFLQKTGETPEDEILYAMTRLVLAGIEFGLDCILFFLITDVNSRGKPTTGSRTYYAILSKLFSRGYRIARSPQLAAKYVESHHKSVVEFLTKIVNSAERKCKEIQGKEISERITRELVDIFSIFKKYNIEIHICKTRR